MSLTKVTPAIIAVTNNITSNTFGSANTIPSFQVDGSGVIIAASNTAINLTANSVANNQFQTGSIENYMRAQGTMSGMRNRIINGAMMIDQRNAGASGTAQGYTLDRWGFYPTQSSKLTWQQDSSANTVAGFTSSLKVTSASSYSVTSSDFFEIYQMIEGVNVADLRWGTANAKAITLSFWTRSSLTGPFGGFLCNNDASRIYPFSYTISSANTWEQKFITIPGDTSGTWLTNTSTGLQLAFGLGHGSNFNGTAGAWTGTSSNYLPSGSTSIVGTSGATWYLTGVQLEAGSQPTPFEYRQYGTELALCQRYYQKFGPNIDANANDGGIFTCANWNGSTFYGGVILPTTMRTSPSLSYSSVGGLTYYSGGGSATLSALVTNGGNTNRFEVSGNPSSSFLTSGYAGWVRISASNYISLSAEL